jgi:hypothetical protein
MIRVITAGLLALVGMTTIGVAVANADEVEVSDLKYNTEASCISDGPHVELEYNDHLYHHFDCRMGGDGYWHVFLSP